MKNYYDQQKELEIAKARLQTLKEQKKMYFEKTQPKSKKIDGEMVSSSKIANNVFLNYVEKTERIDIQIDIIKKEIALLECYLKKMEYNLRSMKGILEKVFVDRYIDNMDVRKIANKHNYSISNIYEILKKIKRIIR